MASCSPTVFEFLVKSDCLSVLIPRNLPRRAPAGSLTASGGRTFSSCLTHSSYLSHAKDLTCGQAAAGARRVDRKFEPHCPLSLLPRRPPALVYLRGDAGSDRTPTSRRGAGRRGSQLRRDVGGDGGGRAAGVGEGDLLLLLLPGGGGGGGAGVVEAAVLEPAPAHPPPAQEVPARAARQRRAALLMACTACVRASAPCACDPVPSRASVRSTSRASIRAGHRRRAAARASSSGRGTTFCNENGG